MLLTLVIIYLLITIAIGLIAAKRVKNSADFAIAGRHLPIAMIITTTFATWFGSETVLGIPARFVNTGLGGVIEDPFGAGICLILVGAFFASKLYKMSLLTISDYFRERFGREVEIFCSVIIMLSYLGWVSAQVTALGLVFNVLSAELISLPLGMTIGVISILAYTLFGGMWSVAITDFIQMIILVLGLAILAVFAGEQAGGASAVLNLASSRDMFHLLPEPDFKSYMFFFASALTMMLGSIPQQDVFQRITSSKNVNIAVNAAILGGVLYFIFAFVPMYLAYSATLISPDLVKEYLDTDPQMILPKLILNHAPLIAQVMFFGALLSAIKSCASATLLAPSVTFAENIVRGFFKHLSDHELLKIMRITVLCFAVVVTFFAINSELSIFKMVESAYKVTLVAAFVPLAFGVYWSKANSLGGLLAVVGGLTVWISSEILAPNAIVPPQLAGLFASIAGMILGSLVPKDLLKAV